MTKNFVSWGYKWEVEAHDDLVHWSVKFKFPNSELKGATGWEAICVPNPVDSTFLQTLIQSSSAPCR